MGDKKVDVIGMGKKQMIVDVLVLPLLSPKQKKKRKNGKDKKENRSRGGCY